MDYNAEKNTIVIFGKEEKLDALARKLSSLSGEQVYNAFVDRGIAIPRKMNCLALMSVINNRLKTIHASELSRDFFNRLKYYKEFSEVQLMNLFLQICDNAEDFKQYRINLFKLILINFVSLNLTDGEINYLKTIKKLRMTDTKTYLTFISSMSQEQEDTFDGQNMAVLRDCLEKSAVSQDVIDLASKYGIPLQTSLKKLELIDFIENFLKKENRYTPEVKQKLEESTLAKLNTFCKANGIPVSSNMTKKELIAYLFYILEQCEISITSVRRIEVLPEFEPLDFTVDLTVFKGFKRDNTRRVIIYEGCENDPFEPLIEDEPTEDDILDCIPSKDEVVNNQQASSAEAKKDEVVSTDGEVSEAEIDQFIEKLQQDQIIEAMPEVVEKPAVDSTMLDVRINEHYGNDKLEGASKSPIKKILFGLMCALTAAILIFVVIILFIL